jgi:hypothetical protein
MGRSLRGQLVETNISQWKPERRWSSWFLDPNRLTRLSHQPSAPPGTGRIWTTGVDQGAGGHDCRRPKLDYILPIRKFATGVAAG